MADLTTDNGASRLSLDQSSVEELNLALRHYRRLLLRLGAFLVLAPVALLGLVHLNTWLSPPYGVYFLGWDLVTWGLLAILALLFAEFWWEGRQIGQALNNPSMIAFPIGSLLSGPQIIAERAKAMGMEWSGFYGPLRPIRRR